MKHEQSFADTFQSFMRNEALRCCCRFHSFSLDGQDRDAGADYILTDADRFAIVEFKYTANDLVSEKFKYRRFTLCQKLLDRDDMGEYHDKCHFVSWTEPPSRNVKINIYRNEICAQSVFGNDCSLPLVTPKVETQTFAKQFAKDFFSSGGAVTLSLEEFQAYVDWVLTDTSGSSRSTLELVAYNPESNDLALIHLNSIAEAQLWVQAHIPQPPRNQMGMSYEP